MRYSHFLVTVNTNTKPKTQTEWDRLNDDFTAALDDLFGKDDNLIEFALTNDIRKKDGTIEYSDTDMRTLYFSPKLKSVNFYTQVEQGTKFGRMHSHTLITIEHTTKIQINKDGIQDYFNQPKFGNIVQSYNRRTHELSSGVYVNVKVVKQDFMNVLDYVSKTRATHKFEIKDLGKGILQDLYQTNRKPNDIH